LGFAGSFCNISKIQQFVSLAKEIRDNFRR
jgi:hypothetical protein